MTGLSYDLNGNIKSLNRLHPDYHNINPIDALSYTYEGNKLLNVQDTSDFNDSKIVNDFQQGGSSGLTAEHYEYDDNGNVISDLNKKITEVEYNFLNLPQKVALKEEANDITYLYDAAGNKLKVTNPDGSTTDYIAGIHYELRKEGGVLREYSFFQHSEGKYDLDKKEYFYNLTDHLGNVRQVLNKDGEVQQSTDYYPFGLVAHQNGGTVGNNKYLYNNKELQDNTGWYDYGARMYDAQIGRWHVVDPLAEKDYSMSPYNYVANNPITNFDPDGMRIRETNSSWVFTGIDAQEAFSVLQQTTSQRSNNNQNQSNGILKRPKPVDIFSDKYISSGFIDHMRFREQTDEIVHLSDVVKSLYVKPPDNFVDFFPGIFLGNFTTSASNKRTGNDKLKTGD